MTMMKKKLTSWNITPTSSLFTFFAILLPIGKDWFVIAAKESRSMTKLGDNLWKLVRQQKKKANL